MCGSLAPRLAVLAAFILTVSGRDTDYYDIIVGVSRICGIECRRGFVGEKARFAARRNLRIVGSLKVARECDGEEGVDRLDGWMEGGERGSKIFRRREMSGRNGREENPRIV